MSKPDDIKRWSGYASQSPAWKAGYEWAYGRGNKSNLGLIEFTESLGYDFDSDESYEVDRGAQFAQQEQSQEEE